MADHLCLRSADLTILKLIERGKEDFFLKINVPARLMDAYIKTSAEFNIYNLFLWGGGSFVGLCDPHPPSAVSLPYRFFA